MGECLIDFLPYNREGQIDKLGWTEGFRMYPGGSPLNIAVGIARSGQPVAFACKIANDYFGRYLRAYIEKEGIDTRYLAHVEGYSTLAFVALEEGNAVFSFYGERAADALMTIDNVPEMLFMETSILHVGSISLLRGTTPTAVLETFERLKGKALLSLDPNIRPDLVRDEQSYRALLQRFFALTDLLKLSDVDLAWLMPGKSVEQGVRELLAQGPALVIVTQGAEGVFAMKSESRPLQVPAFSVAVVDTVGAGDAFCAGILTMLAERRVVSHPALLALSDDDLETILRFALGVAALNCTREGADPPRRAEVEHFLVKQVD
jgi:fructokinase